MARKITMIPQTINPQTRTAMDTRTKRKVAGYARVSTDYEEQITSYEAQVDHSQITFKVVMTGSLSRSIQTQA